MKKSEIKIKMILALLIFITVLLISTKVSALGSVSLSASKSNVTTKDTFTISVNLSGVSVATLTARVNFDTSKVEYVSGPSNSNLSGSRVIYTWTDPTGGDNPKTGGTLATFTFRAKNAGSAVFSVSGDFYSPNETSVNPSFSGATVIINEPVVTPPVTEPENPTPSEPPTTEGGGGSTPTPPAGGGNTGNNNSSNSTNNKSTNANLKSLQLDIEGLSPTFNKNTTNYYLVIPDNIDNIAVAATPEDSKATVAIEGNQNIPQGASKISIIVTAQSGAKKTYTINVTKTANIENANANLENLAIENVFLVPEFNENITEYTSNISSTHEGDLNILAVPKVPEAKVVIQGNENIQFGSNIINIIVTAKDDITTKEYIINAYKLTEEEEQALTLLEEGIIEPIIEEEVTRKITMGEIAFCSLVVVGVGVCIYIIIRRYKLTNKEG